MLTFHNYTTLSGSPGRPHQQSDLGTILLLSIFGLMLSIAMLTPYVRHQTIDESFWASEMIGP